MKKLSRDQVVGIKKVFDRRPIYINGDKFSSDESREAYCKKVSYLQFLRTAHYSHLMGCVMLPWEGMILGIEADGHTHS